jgi:hypothetical protein
MAGPGGNVAQLTGVHGIGKEYLGRNQILDRWTPALADGIEHAVGRRPHRPDLDLAFYGDLFRKAPRPGKGTGTTDNDAAELAALDDEELAELTETVEEIVRPADLAAAAAGVNKSLWLPVPVQVLVGAIERRFPPTSGVLFLGDLRQVRKYLRDERLKARVQQIMAGAATGTTVLIAHSLGSVVAYEFLQQSGQSVPLLLTIGSPLGLRMVRSRLSAGGPLAARWVNVRDPNDPVTAAGSLRQWYHTVEERRAENGADAHCAEHYLSSEAVGQVVTETLPAIGL